MIRLREEQDEKVEPRRRKKINLLRGIKVKRKENEERHCESSEGTEGGKRGEGKVRRKKNDRVRGVILEKVEDREMCQSPVTELEEYRIKHLNS